MIESIRTNTGAVSINTNQNGKILLEAKGDLSHQTHPLTVEQCHVLIHALARAIELDAKGGAV